MVVVVVVVVKRPVSVLPCSMFESIRPSQFIYDNDLLIFIP